jgi:hypothetical protein
MSDTQTREDVPLGRYLAHVREEVGLTQAQLAGKVTFSPNTVELGANVHWFRACSLT